MEQVFYPSRKHVLECQASVKGWLYIHCYLVGSKCKSSICKSKCSLWKTRYNLSSIPYNKSMQFRKYLGTIRFYKEAMVTRKHHNFTSSPFLLSFVQWETIFSFWHSIPVYISLLPLRSAVIPQHTVFLVSSWLPWVWLALDHTVQASNTTSGHLRAGTASLPHHRSYHNLSNKNESTSKKSHLGCPASSLLELQWLLCFWNNVAQKAGLPGTEFLLLGSSQLLSLPAFSLQWQFIGCPTPFFFFFCLLNFLFSGQGLYLTHLAVYFPCTWARTCQMQGKKRAVPHWTCHSATAMPVNIKIQHAWEWNRSCISVLPPACTFILGSSQKALEDGLKQPCLPRWPLLAVGSKLSFPIPPSSCGSRGYSFLCSASESMFKITLHLN